MKHLLIAGLLFFTIQNFTNAQTQAGIKIGASSFLLPEQLIQMENDELKVTLKEGYYGLHGGVYVRIGAGLFAVQPELIFNSNSVAFELEDLTSSTGIKEIIKERYFNLDLPVMLVFKPSILRFYAGPVGHYSMQSLNELSNWGGWKNAFNRMSVGYQAGGGIQFNGFSVDLRYEGRILAGDNEIIIDDQVIELSKNPSRILFTLGFRLL
ncbi:MAG TPA: hypothetical protein DCQ58_09415 [Saprospirales bacterium]|nr:hypothetical protein [Saprospirales bacterium]